MWSRGTAGKALSALFLGHSTCCVEDKDLLFHRVTPAPGTRNGWTKRVRDELPSSVLMERPLLPNPSSSCAVFSPLMDGEREAKVDSSGVVSQSW